jgi:hypothetical protein
VGLAAFFGLAFPSFISSCGLGGILTIAAMIAAASGGMSVFRRSGIAISHVQGEHNMGGNPWDPPPFPKRGNNSQATLFSAIGRALTTWEELESFLSNLYSSLCEKSAYDEKANFVYGQFASVNRRMDELNRVGSSYFTKRPNQNFEGELCSIIRDVNGWSARRNDVAHGVVRFIGLVRDNDDYIGKSLGHTLLTVPIEWCLVPPHFKENKYVTGNTPAHILTSYEINKFAKAFWPLIRRVYRLSEAVELRRFALQRKRALPPPLIG